MQVPIGWLKELVNHDYSLETLQETLTAVGLEAELFTPEPVNFHGVIIGKIASRENTPDGRGFVYTVEVGGAFEGGKVDIYSTIPDLETGVKYPVALPGGRVGELEITQRKYDTFTSQGKFCCATELELTKLEFVENDDGTVGWVDNLEDVDGRALSIFPDVGELDVGEDLATWLLSDPAVTIELTTNRADCHSMIGVAREMQVITGSEYRLPQVFDEFEVTSGKAEGIEIIIDDPHGCRMYAGFLIDKIRVAPSPLWLCKKLFTVGLRPISNIVDITNLVLYETGQPLHGFDYKLINDATIIVRRARDGETMTTIDGVVRKLSTSDLVIADKNDPVAIAGVMGGFASEVTGDTKKVLIESALFDPISVRRTSRRLALRTEAAIRFERGVDPEGVIRAVHRTAQLVKDLQCGEPAGEIAVALGEAEEAIEIWLSEEHIASLLGVEIPTGQIEMILDGLGFELDGVGPTWKVTVPSFRRDIFIEEDIIEEIARHFGYDNLPEELPDIAMRSGLLEQDLMLRFELKTRLAGLGLWELNSFPLQADSTVSKPNILLENATPAKIQNPISEDASNLRINLVPGVVETFVRNLKRGAPIKDVFEIGKVYWHNGNDFDERRELIISCLGERTGKSKLRNREKAFLRLKGYVESILEIAGISGYDIIANEKPPKGTLVHWIKSGDDTIGVFEAVLEDILDGETFDRPVFTAVFPWEFIRDNFVKSNDEKLFVKLPTFPATLRDLAFVMDESIAYSRMQTAIRESAGEFLERVELFDVYRGKQVGDGMKNLAVNLKFRHPERTLTDEEVDGWISSVIDRVKENTGGKLRDW